MTDHTPGKIRSCGMGGDSILLSEVPHEKWPQPDYYGWGYTMAVPRHYKSDDILCTDIAAGFIHDDAKRIAACWNAFHGVPTKDIVIAALDAAKWVEIGPDMLEALISARRHLKEISEDCYGNYDRPDLDEIIDRAKEIKSD